MAKSGEKNSASHLRFLRWHALTDARLAELERRWEEKWRLAYEAHRAVEQERIERLRRDAEAMKESVERECRRLRAECNESIRRQYEVFDRQWKDREDRTGSKVHALRRELENTATELSGRTETGRKLLALAIDPRTPEAEAVAAFLKARARGIRLRDGFAVED